MSRLVSRLAAIAVFASLAGCSSLLAFDTDLSMSGAVPGALSHVGQLPTGVDASSSLQKSFDSNGMDTSQVQSLKITSGGLSATQSGSGNNLVYFKSFEVYVSANGKDETLLGHIDPAKFTKDVTSAPLILEDVELKPFLTAGSMKVTPKIELDNTKRPASDVPIALSLKVHVVPQL